jgi:hypothetical protein
MTGDPALVTPGPLIFRLCAYLPWFWIAKLYVPGLKLVRSRVIENSFSVTPTFVPVDAPAAAAAALGPDVAGGVVVFAVLVPPQAASRANAKDAVTTRAAALPKALVIRTPLIIGIAPVVGKAFVIRDTSTHFDTSAGCRSPDTSQETLRFIVRSTK